MGDDRQCIGTLEVFEESSNRGFIEHCPRNFSEPCTASPIMYVFVSSKYSEICLLSVFFCLIYRSLIGTELFQGNWFVLRLADSPKCLVIQQYGDSYQSALSEVCRPSIESLTPMESMSPFVKATTLIGRI